MLINAAGPWVDEVIGKALGKNDANNVRLVQGSHIIVPKFFDHDRCYIFQNADNRIIFAIPYERDFTLIGTTDQDYHGDVSKVEISDSEINYLCDAASEYFEKQVRPRDIVWTYSGVRPLYNDGASKAQEATRDYVLKVEGSSSEGAVLNIFGGKITTYRRLAEHVMEKIEDVLGKKKGSWTRGAKLPGGAFETTGFNGEVKKLKSAYPFLTDRQATRYVRLYGSQAQTLLGTAKTDAQLGTKFGAEMTEAEVRYLMTHEWALTAEDVLWRRTKAGLVTGKDDAAALDKFMSSAGRLAA
jgi:glycerol-3-phosphate dehydrogenase